MEVANEKIVAPSLFDLVAPSRAISDGPSFRDCLQVCPTAPPRPSEPAPRHSDAANQSQERTRPADAPTPTAECNGQPEEDKLPEANETPAADLDESAGPSAADEQKEESMPEEVLVEAAVAIVQPTSLPEEVDLGIVVDEQVVAAADSSSEEGGKQAPAKLQLGAESAHDGEIALPVEMIAEEKLPLVPDDASGTDVAPGAALLTGLEKQQDNQAQTHQVKTTPITGKEKGVRRGRDQASVDETAANSETAERGIADAVKLQDTDSLVPIEQLDQAATDASGEPTEAKKSATLDAAVPTINKDAASPSSVSDATSETSPVAAETASGSTPRETVSPPPAASEAIVGTSPAARPPAALLKSKSGHIGPASQPGELDPAKFLHRVAKAFESAQQRVSDVKLRLHPAELGSLSVQIHVQEGVLSARLQVETSEARTALIENLPALRERLAEQGIRIEQFDVDLQDHSQRQQQSLREQFQEQQAQRDPVPRTSKTRAVSREPATVAPARTPGLGGLNVIV